MDGGGPTGDPPEVAHVVVDCPACGAPAAGDPDGVCDYCHRRLPARPVEPPAGPRTGASPFVVAPIAAPDRRSRLGLVIALTVSGAVLAVIGVFVAVAVMGVHAVSSGLAASQGPGIAALEATARTGAAVPGAPGVPLPSAEPTGPAARMVVTGAASFDGRADLGIDCTVLLASSLRLSITDGPLVWTVEAAPPGQVEGPGTWAAGRGGARITVRRDLAGGVTTWTSAGGGAGTVTRSPGGAYDVAFQDLPGDGGGPVSGTLALTC